MNTNPRLLSFTTPNNALSDYTNGVGKTSEKTFLTTIQVDPNTYKIGEVLVPRIMVEAVALRNIQEADLVYLSAGYFGRLHSQQDQGSEGKKSGGELPGHYLTSAEFLGNCQSLARKASLANLVKCAEKAAELSNQEWQKVCVEFQREVKGIYKTPYEFINADDVEVHKALLAKETFCKTLVTLLEPHCEKIEIYDDKSVKVLVKSGQGGQLLHLLQTEKLAVLGKLKEVLNKGNVFDEKEVTYFVIGKAPETSSK